jgi:DNA-binding MarR family transcriptional regulator/GNAT superfamily N-acetyltransferase
MPELSPAAAADPLEERIATFRRFTRFYTRQMGWLHRGILNTPFSMTEGRVLYEIAHREPTTASALVADLRLDHAHLSRMLRRFEENGLVKRVTAREDGRQRLLRLTPKGRRAFDALNQGSRDQVAGLLGPLPARDQARVVAAMASVESMLSQAPAEPAAGLALRPHQPGDMGWVMSINGALYAREYGWDMSYEALVGRITADFLDHVDPARERCWIAELDGERVGSVFVVRKSDTVAQLRLLVVDPKARGLGLGTRLVNECLAFATAAGYESMTLWTQSILTSARAIYARAGFERISEAPHHSFGVDLVGEIWERALRAESPADGPVR